MGVAVSKNEPSTSGSSERRVTRQSTSSNRTARSSTASPDWVTKKEVKNLSEHYKPTYICQYCGDDYQRSNNLARHILNNCPKNPDVKPRIQTANVCPSCGCRFKKQKALTYHIKHVCEKYVICDYCNLKFKGNILSRRHTENCMRKLRINGGGPSNGLQISIHRKKLINLSPKSKPIFSSSDSE
ncbi:hypothetical protein KM043_007636 [Ampulex compressa]|nr:hypothetical protein KM043_007636 [Ampulex compressa]